MTTIFQPGTAGLRDRRARWLVRLFFFDNGKDWKSHYHAKRHDQYVTIQAIDIYENILHEWQHQQKLCEEDGGSYLGTKSGDPSLE
jgi:hypothetical protein